MRPNKQRKPLKYSVEGCRLHEDRANTTCNECLQNYNKVRDKIRNQDKWLCEVCNKSTSPKNKTNHIRSLHHRFNKLLKLQNQKD